MQHKKPPKFTETTDTDGQAVVLVELNNIPGVSVKLLKDDFSSLADRGLNNYSWYAVRTKNFLYAVTPDRTTGRPVLRTVASLVLNPKKREQVTYKDGNPFNLRRDNLILRRFK